MFANVIMTFAPYSDRHNLNSYMIGIYNYAAFTDCRSVKKKFN